MSLWRKRGTSETVATDVHHNEQKPDHLINILNKLHDENVRLGLYEGVYDLSIQSDDLSIKREKAMREVQRLGQEIEQSKGIEMRQALEMAIEWIEKQPEETPDSKYDVDTRYVVLRELEAALAQPEQEPAKCVGLTDEQKNILNFLLGASDIDDVWFGDKHPTEKGQFWWRNRLRKVFQEAAYGIKE